MSREISVAVLTVSDTAAQDASTDRSGPTIRQILADNGFINDEGSCRIVPDDVRAIQTAVKDWADAQHDWIITTGGTGFGVRDTTPEAISALLERPAPGLVHLLLASSLKHTPLAALSRPVAGTYKRSLITTLPGSPKAVKECMEALLAGGVVRHAVELIGGGTGRDVHSHLAQTAQASKSTQNQGGHSCSHHSHHHAPPKPRSGQALSYDPSAPVSGRHRQSPYPIISLDEALKHIQDQIKRLPVESRAVDHTLRGHVLAENVYAHQNVPATRTTNVDGYAVRASSPPGVYDVLTSSSHSPSTLVPDGSIFRINTGGPLPPGTDAVIMVEDTKLVATHPGTGEEARVETLAQVEEGENVRAEGSDVESGDLVMQAGERIFSIGGEVGTLTFVGRKEVKVYRKPVVALLSTGNELVDLQRPSGSGDASESWGGIFDTNRPALQAVLEGLGYEVVDLGIVNDKVEDHVAAIQRGLSSADLILTTGGTSMGPTDLLKPVIERNLHGTTHFGRVAIKPGKPTTFATIPCASRVGGGDEVHTPIFALPGNPASALVTFYVFVLPALRSLGGWPEAVQNLPRVRVQLKSPMPLDPRVEFHRVVVKVDLFTGVLQAWSTGGQRSSRVASLNGANGFVVVPALGGQTKARLEPGEWAEAILVGELQVA